AQNIIETLARCGLESDQPVMFQSARSDAYQAAFEQLQAAGLIYGCACSRKDIDMSSTSVYPGTCAHGAPSDKPIRSFRVRVPDDDVSVIDRAVERYAQNLKHDVGDFIVKRADGLWAYQLAVVVDDAAQGITDVVRGADLLDNTPRQIFLQRALGLPTPRYLHVPLVLNANGEKLSKQSGAVALDIARPVAELQRAARHLGLGEIEAPSVDRFLSEATERWAQRYPRS
ncbi:MAG: tRNA glutamyl-Q(34) synthetase GluQRS, partial [Burkholderiaceae bacterium]